VGRRALVALGLLALAFFVLFPIGAGIYVTRTPREPIDGAFSVPHEDVALETRDGLTIKGWYAPSKNGAAIVFVHGSGGSRQGPRRQARLLGVAQTGASSSGNCQRASTRLRSRKSRASTSAAWSVSSTGCCSSVDQRSNCRGELVAKHIGDVDGPRVRLDVARYSS
jgi:hypothetical protein